MRTVTGPPISICFLKRNNAAVASKHISEPYRCEFSITHPVHRLHDYLSKPFRSAHDVGRVHRFVSGDEYEFLRPKVYCTTACVEGSEHIVLYCFGRVAFHQRNMLVRCCMEHNAWLVALEYLSQPLSVTA